MRAGIANKDADTYLKTEQARWEPWKAMSAAFGAGVAFATAMSAVFGWIAWSLAHLSR